MKVEQKKLKRPKMKNTNDVVVQIRRRFQENTDVVNDFKCRL